MIAYSNKFSYTYNGTFSEIDSTHLISYSNVTAMDFDHIGTQAEMTDLRNWLIKTPCVLCVFVTPGGRRLKALILHDNTDPDRHRDLYAQKNLRTMTTA